MDSQEVWEWFLEKCNKDGVFLRGKSFTPPVPISKHPFDFIFVPKCT